MIRFAFTFFIFGFCHLFLTSAVPVKKEGVAMGILAAKGDAWVDLKEDDGFQHRYLAPWVGGAPSKGGRFDGEMLDLIANTVVGNRVEVKWKFDGHLRLLELAVIIPLKKEGVFVGKLIEIGDHWVDFENPEDRIPWRFYLRWIGGYPENGGGYDGKSRQDLLAQIDEPVIRFYWSYDVRPRFEKILELESFQEPLFYVSKDKIPQTAESRKQESSVEVNPFDILPTDPINPFENSTGFPNPFDQKSSPVANPFDQPGAVILPSSSDSPPASMNNPFEQGPSGQKINPFDLPKVPKVNPFDQNPSTILPGQVSNPFEQSSSHSPPVLNP